MSNKHFENNHTRTIVISCIALVIGILLCCSISLGELLSWFIGIAIALCGAMYIINSILQKRTVLNAESVFGAILIAFGIMFIIKRLANIIVGFLPYLMIAIGIVVLADAFLAKFVRHCSLVVFIVMLVIGTALTALGFCFMFINVWQNALSIALGCVLIIVSVYSLIKTFVAKSK